MTSLDVLTVNQQNQVNTKEPIDICQSCFIAYSVTVGTLFHKTHVDLYKWFQAIHLILNDPSNISVRQLAGIIGVNKNTAAEMRNKIFKAMQEELELLQKLIENGISEE